MVLISGGGTTLRNLLEKSPPASLRRKSLLRRFEQSEAGGLRFAENGRHSRPTIIERRQFQLDRRFSAAVFDACRAAVADLVVMGGFLKLLAIPRRL